MLVIDSERISRILDFLKVIENLKLEKRASYLSDNSRHESVAEHTWHMSMFALLLYKEMTIDVDISHVLKLIIIHDLVEVYASDTFAYDTDGYRNKKEREEAAADKLFALLPEDLQNLLSDWWQEFELANTPEAKFANAIDKLQAFAQNLFTHGRVWQERCVTEEMSRIRNQSAMELDSKLARVFEVLYLQANYEDLWYLDQ